MKADELRVLIRKANRKPVRICIDDGRTYTVSHPDFAMVADGAVLLGSGPGHDLGGANFIVCYFEHISGVEQLKQKAKTP